MVQALFFIRFRAQLRRTRPELVSYLENAVSASAAATGGKVEAGRKLLSVFFDEERIGFWLDIVIFLEKLREALKETGPYLYGYALALGRDIPDSSVRKLCLSLSGSKSADGAANIWCSEEVRKPLEFYAEFDDPARAKRDEFDSYRALRRVKPFDKAVRPNRQESHCREKIEKALAQGNGKNTILLGPESMEKRDSLYRYCADLLGGIPPLAVRFGAGGRGIVCFADAYTPDVRSFITGAAPEETIEGLDAAQNLLFRERLREEWAPSVKERGRGFIRSLLAAYTAAVKSRGCPCVVFLEDASLAGGSAPEVFKEAYLSLDEKPAVFAPGGFPENGAKNWGGVFSRVLKFTPGEFPPEFSADYRHKFLRDLPVELWEVSYNIILLGRYFPAYLLPRLFEEEGLNRDMYARALRALSAGGVFGSGDPCPLIPGFESRAEEILGSGGKEKIRAAVRGRILDWTGSRRLRPCFNLLRVLSELGGAADDALVLKSLRADVLNGTWEGIDEALEKGYFASLVGAGNAPALKYIYKTLRALVWGGSEEIEQAFQEPAPPLTAEDGRPCYGGCRAQVEANLAAYYIGSRNNDAASEAVRKARLLNRDLGKDVIPAYRLFSLVNLSKQQIDDALEYISFALDQAERSEQQEELLLTCYYAASINFLHGNLARAERLALRAEETAAGLGQPVWGKRAKFLRGRVCFEIGRYEDALALFESLAAGETGDSVDPAVNNTVRAWVFRAGNFLSRRFSSRDGGASSAGLDAGLFSLEAAYYAGDYERAAALAGDYLSSAGKGPGMDFLFTEQPDWRSGFCQCEYLFQPEKSPGAKFAWVYRAMARIALRPHREARAEILAEMQRFMREELLPDTGPGDAFYFHAWYRMLRDSMTDGGAAQVDMNTVVSMAYKRLQRRAGRIEDKEMRQAFLNQPLWNRTLCLAARDYKLI
jgi:tetratricopeptide (TPR) repeat protein